LKLLVTGDNTIYLFYEISSQGELSSLYTLNLSFNYFFVFLANE